MEFRDTAEAFHQDFLRETTKGKGQKTPLVKGSFLSYTAPGDTLEMEEDSQSANVVKMLKRPEGSFPYQMLKRPNKHQWVQRDSVSVPARTCKACGVKGHTLQACWIVFPDKGPEDFEPSAQQVRMVNLLIEDDKELKDEVEQVCKQKQKKVSFAVKEDCK